MGAAAILLSNKSSYRYRSKYRLAHIVHTHEGAKDKSYKCVYQQEDESQRQGVSLAKELMVVAREALKTNVTILGPLVLPMSEQLRFLATLVAKKIFQAHKIKQYIPNLEVGI